MRDKFFKNKNYNKLLTHFLMMVLLIFSSGCSKKKSKVVSQSSTSVSNPSTNPTTKKINHYFDGQVDINANGYVFKASFEDSQEAQNQNSSGQFIFQGEVYE
jgi:outer membrane biogenesis lipoprotein LolB